jgi:hypothetical protein
MSFNGSEGARMIYPNSKTNPQYFILGRGPNSIQGGNISGSEPNFRFGGGQQRANIVANGAGGSRGLADHSRALSQGYMNSPKDWRNFEMTLGITGWTGGDGITMYGRGGGHTGNKGCEGFAYKGTLYRTGRVRMAKESWHVKYDYWDDSNTGGGNENIGFKFICFDNGQFVTLEIWIDPGNANNWRMVKREIDNGFGSGGAGCGYTDGGPGLWGGPYCTLRSDEDDINFKFFSVREINPFGSFGQGSPTNPSSPPSSPGSTPSDTGAPPGDPSSGGGFPGEMGGVIPSIGLGTGYRATAQAGGGKIVNAGPSGVYQGGGIQGGGEGGQFTGPDSTATTVPQLGDITESPVVTVFKDFYDRYDVVSISGNACGVGTYNEAKDLVELFRGATSPNYLKMSATGFDAIQVGQKVVTAQSQLFNKVPRRVEAVFKKFGSPTGNIFCRVRDKKGNLKQELGTFAAAAVGLNDTDVEFQEDDAEYKLQVGDVIWIEYSADGDGSTKYLLYKRGDQDAADAYNSWFVVYTSTTIEDQLNDLAASIYE